MESSRQIEERAAAWLLKRDSGHWSDEDQAQFTAWIEATALNRVAFLRLEAGWEEANRLKALGAGFPRGKVPSVGELTGTVPGSAFSQVARFKYAAAAILALAVGLYAYHAEFMQGQRYSTPIGGVASVPLKDGTNVTLNTASKIRVRITEAERRIDLAQGEAFFDVAKDPVRPFVVQAGDTRVIAIGTQFSVRRDRDDVRVIVTEGQVRLENLNDSESGAVFTPGTIASAQDTKVAVRERPLPEAEELLSWRTGYLVFRETTLADAIAEFNRYNERKILIHDPAVAAMQLTGKFKATNYETFVRLLEDTFQIQARHTADRIILTART